MDREILFRGFQEEADGKSIAIINGNSKRGTWIYGNLVRTDDGVYIIQNYVPPHMLPQYEVVPSTVGQYTGLTDTKKHKAFVDDIVRYKNTHTVYGVIRFGEIPETKGKWKHIGYYIEWQNDGANMWGVWWRYDLGYWLDDPRCEICGNIHDNPELIGGEDNG